MGSYEFQSTTQLLAVIPLIQFPPPCQFTHPTPVHHARRPSYRKFFLFYLYSTTADCGTHAFTQDISAAEQVSLHELTVPELSPSDPTSSASSPSSSVPVTPLDPPLFSATQPDPLVHGKHQPDPQPFRPVSKSAPRGLGTVWRARQVLLGLGKRKRRASADISISTGVELLTDYYDVPELPDSNSAPEITEPRHSQVT
jgi:hypothetical protein